MTPSEVKAIENKLEGISRDVSEIKTVLLGVPGNSTETGLCGKVQELSKSHYNLKRNFLALVAFLIGAGVLTGTGVGISELMKAK